MLSAVFAWLDAAMAALPDAARLGVWAAIGSLVSTTLYGLLSPQRRLRNLARRRNEVRRRLMEHEGTTSQALPLLRAQLRLAVRQLLLVLGPSLAAIVPVLLLILWLDGTYGYRFPDPGRPTAVETEPPGVAATLTPVAGAGPAGRGPPLWAVAIEGPRSEDFLIALRAPVPSLAKADWWHAVFGAPGAALPEGLPVDAVRIDLPVREYLPFGPAWLRPWYVIFLGVMLAASLALKRGLRLQ